MSATVVATLVFVFTLAIVYGAYWFAVLREEDQETRQLRKRLKTSKLPAAVFKSVGKAEERLSSVGAIDRLLADSEKLVAPLHRLLMRSGLNITLGTIVLASLFLGVVGLLLGQWLIPLWEGQLILAAIFGTVPILYVRYAANKRIAKFEDLFPEAIDLMARALRAGHALTTSLQMVADEIPEPVGAEFKLLFDRQNFGMSLPEALREFGLRVPLVDARFFVTAVLTQRETGGNLSEVLDNLASVIRERFKVKRQVRVMSAHGRITGWVLGAMPPVIGVILFIISPQLIRLLVDDPLGRMLLGGAAVLQVVGVLAIRKIVDVEY
ncbi:MAG: type II secretion system F family protein [Acidobacteriaceae bacterium]|jgi:tight adherence protein B|nr:type II secretion system F family protein [Acidobacteriaceae bacterium]